MNKKQNIIKFIISEVMISCFFILFFNLGFANSDWTVKLDGLVSNENGRIEGATITLQKNLSTFQEIITPKTGTFIFILKPGNEYIIEASKPGYFTKKIYFSTRNVTAKNESEEFQTFPVDIFLYEKIDGIDAGVLDNPVGKILFSAETNDFEIDMDYAKSIKGQMTLLERNINSRKMELERLKRKQEDERNSFYKSKSVNTAGHTSELSHPKGNLISKNGMGSNHSLQILTGMDLLNDKRNAMREELSGISDHLVKLLVITDGNKEILIKVINRSGKEIEYRKVTQPWGTEYFFKDEASVTSHIYLLESDLEQLLLPKFLKL